MYLKNVGMKIRLTRKLEGMELKHMQWLMPGVNNVDPSTTPDSVSANGTAVLWPRQLSLFLAVFLVLHYISLCLAYDLILC